VTCELESVELVGRVLGGVWEGLQVYVLRGVESQLMSDENMKRGDADGRR